MKTVIVQNENLKFTPIQIALTIESLEELVELAARLNLPHGHLIEENRHYSDLSLPKDTTTYELWKELDNQVEKLVEKR